MNNQKTFLTPEQVEIFVNENKYEFDQGQWYLSRCIDGRYDVREDLEPLAKPGADIGDLMIALATNHQYALNLKPEVVLEVLIDTVGGKENFSIHMDDHVIHSKNKLEQCVSCGHFGQAFADPEAYGLEKHDVDFIAKALQELKSDKARNIILTGEHTEQAVIIVKSQNYSVAPRMIKEGRVTECFVYQKTLDDKRRRLLAENLLPHIKVDREINEEYIYEILTTVADQQLFETLARIAPEYPIYNVKIDEEGEVSIED